MKMSFNRRKLVLFFPALFLLLAVACAITGKGLTTRLAREGDVGDGPFTVILYSTSEYSFLQTAAFLDIEGDGYELQPFGASFKYTLIKGLAGSKAVERAREFIVSRVVYNKLELRAIMGPAGTVIGYELRPLLLPINYGQSDVLDIYYDLGQEGRITVYVRLKDSIKRMFQSDMGTGR